MTPMLLRLLQPFLNILYRFLAGIRYGLQFSRPVLFRFSFVYPGLSIFMMGLRFGSHLFISSWLEQIWPAGIPSFVPIFPLLTPAVSV
jgi:hypothetical protein